MEYNRRKTSTTTKRRRRGTTDRMNERKCIENEKRVLWLDFSWDSRHTFLFIRLFVDLPPCSVHRISSYSRQSLKIEMKILLLFWYSLLYQSLAQNRSRKLIGRITFKEYLNFIYLGTHQSNRIRYNFQWHNLSSKNDRKNLKIFLFLTILSTRDPLETLRITSEKIISFIPFIEIILIFFFCLLFFFSIRIPI